MMRVVQSGLAGAVLAVSLIGAHVAMGQTTAPTTQPAEIVEAVETFLVDGIELRLVDRAPDAPAEAKKALVDTFLKVYPTLLQTFNPEATKQVTILIDPEYKGVAEAGGGRIRVSSRWITERPKDFDLITHEAMHLVQAYPGWAGPSWVTEGIADYVRHVYGVDNAAGGWSLPDVRPNHRFTDSYRVTGRFFLWLEKHVKPGIVQAIDQAMRKKEYTEAIWQEQTGQTLEELWDRYVSNPEL